MELPLLARGALEDPKCSPEHDDGSFGCRIRVCEMREREGACHGAALGVKWINNTTLVLFFAFVPVTALADSRTEQTP
jgi:hypothetical protein